jgi:hypothetical protein
LRLVVAAGAEPVNRSRYGEANAVAGRGGSVVWLTQMVAATPSIFGGTTEIMKEIIGRGL